MNWNPSTSTNASDYSRLRSRKLNRPKPDSWQPLLPQYQQMLAEQDAAAHEAFEAARRKYINQDEQVPF